MYLSEIRERILATLRHGALNQYEIADELSEAPFYVNAELKGLRREQLVRDRLDPKGHLWELTDRGHGILAGRDQLEIDDLHKSSFPLRGGVDR
jgi:predicted transcriptional regulator